MPNPGWGLDEVLKDRRMFYLLAGLSFLFLIGLLLPKFQDINQNIVYSTAENDLSVISTALETYYTYNRAYPPTSKTVCGTYLASPLVKPRIMMAVLHDPFAEAENTEYNYILAQGGRYYILLSVGPDGVSEVTGMKANGALVGNLGDDIHQTNR